MSAASQGLPQDRPAHFCHILLSQVRDQKSADSEDGEADPTPPNEKAPYVISQCPVQKELRTAAIAFIGLTGLLLK